MIYKLAQCDLVSTPLDDTPTWTKSANLNNQQGGFNQ